MERGNDEMRFTRLKAVFVPSVSRGVSRMWRTDGRWARSVEKIIFARSLSTRKFFAQRRNICERRLSRARGRRLAGAESICQSLEKFGKLRVLRGGRGGTYRAECIFRKSCGICKFRARFARRGCGVNVSSASFRARKTGAAA